MPPREGGEDGNHESIIPRTADALRADGLDPAEFWQGRPLEELLERINFLAAVLTRASHQPQSHPEVAAEDFLSSLEQRFDFKSLYAGVNLEARRKIRPQINTLLSVLEVVKDTINSVIKSCEICQDRDMANVTLCSLKTALEELRNGEIQDVLYLMEIMGLLDTAEPLHVEDICGREGISLSLISLARGYEKQTTGRSLEIQRTYGAPFHVLQDLLDLDERGLTFEPGDIRSRKYLKPKQGETCWLAKYPEDMTSHLIGEVSAISPEDMPDGIAIIPCLCHSYSPSQYRPEYGDSISLEEWRKLSKLIDEGAGYLILDHESNMAARAKRIIDLTMARSINRSNPSIKATVQELPSHYGNGILVRRAL